MNPLPHTTTRPCARIANWQDVSFTPLAGWINVYKEPDGTYWTGPCPGVLLQEATTETIVWPDRSETKRIQRETQTVFVATPTMDDGPSLCSQDTLDGDSYVVTTTLEQWTEWQQLLDAERP